MPSCKVCRQPATARFGLTWACSIDHAIDHAIAHAIAHARSQKEKSRRKADRHRKGELKTLSQLVKEAQAEFNRFIRARDYELPCISCGDFTPMTRGGDYDCGHYRSVGANPELRFHEQNANKQCKRCNSHLSGNIANYRIGLLMKYGETVVAEIEGPHEPLKLTRDDARRIKAEYKAKLKALQNPPA